jgi:ribosomal protein S18 acetylase RimI-like enzyme
VLEPLSRSTRREALAFVARRPYENAFMAWILEGGHGPNAPDEILLHRDDAGTITGAIYFGAQLVIAADSDVAIDAFAVEARRHPGLRSFVGPKKQIDRLWEDVRVWHRPPALVRANQPIYALEPAALVATPEVDVRQATPADADAVIENSAEMMLGELGYDPRVNRASFGAGVRRALAQGQWWLYVDEGAIRFQLNVGARTASTAQLQGVWAPPAFRKRGYAFAALGQIAARLLAVSPTLSLYVNDFNHDAITLYERVGFTRVGEMSTLLFA